MRLLEFKVNKQVLSKQPGCDFSHIVADSIGYLRARFNVSSEWDDCKKAASFKAAGSDSEFAVLLDENNECNIPSVALSGEYFTVYLTGVRDRYQIRTTEYKVKQEVL